MTLLTILLVVFLVAVILARPVYLWGTGRTDTRVVSVKREKQRSTSAGERSR